MADKQSLLRMARGEIEKRVDLEVSRVIDNITDPRTDPTAKRSVTVKIEFRGTLDRDKISVSAQATAKLAPVGAAQTMLQLTTDENGELVFREMSAQIAGQTSLTDDDEPEPMELRLLEL